MQEVSKYVSNCVTGYFCFIPKCFGSDSLWFENCSDIQCDDNDDDNKKNNNKYLSNNIVYFLVECCELVIGNEWNEHKLHKYSETNVMLFLFSLLRRVSTCFEHYLLILRRRYTNGTWYVASVLCQLTVSGLEFHLKTWCSQLT
jgi:hypothetical protein